MEALGAIASAISIFELARKINGLRVSVKNAESDWQRYCDSLQAVACVGSSQKQFIRICLRE